MQILQVVKSSDQTLVASHCFHAQKSWNRMVGLLNRKSLHEKEGLLIEPCNSVHTFFMSFSIDVVFLNKENEVIAVQEMPPWRLSRIYWSARKVLELPLGTSQKILLKKGEKLEIRILEGLAYV